MKCVWNRLCCFNTARLKTWSLSPFLSTLCFLFLGLGGEHDFPGFDHTPLMSLQVVAGPHQEAKHHQSLDRHLLPHVVLRAGGPHQVGAHVLGQLALCGWSAIVILDDLVVEWGSHANRTTWEVGVEVLALLHVDSGGSVAVAVQQVVDVVLATMSAKSDEGKIWGDGTVVSICCCSVVRKRPGEVVGQLARAHEHLAVLCGAVQELLLLSQSLGFVFSVGDVDKVPVGKIAHGVASRTDLLVHHVATPDGGVVQRVEVAAVAPTQGRGVQGEVSTNLLIKLVSNPKEASSGNASCSLEERTAGKSCHCCGDEASSDASLVEVNQAIKA